MTDNPFHLRFIQLQAFRNYKSLEQGFNPTPIVLFGKNGSGKTNLLEALSFLTQGKGLRHIKLNEASSLLCNKQPWSIFTTLFTEQGDVTLGTKLDLSSDHKEKRLIQANYTPLRSQVDLLDYLNVVWVTPDMDSLLGESSVRKRRFFDRMVYAFDHEHAKRMLKYEHYLKERSFLLKEDKADPFWLSSLEEQLAFLNVALYHSRLDLVQKLNKFSPHFSSFPKFDIIMEGELETMIASFSSLQAEEAVKEKLYQMRSYDSQHGGASFGCHKTDFIVYHTATHKPAYLCSTGQQKILLLSVILAFVDLLSHCKTWIIPKGTLLLLDDIVAHLDFHHRMVLFEELCMNSTLLKWVQPWMSGTDLDAFMPLKGYTQFFHIYNDTLNEFSL
ncbi:MAG: DNA replication/repair protein RecF [Proteobacteria bacterium]|nr:DNA replication/repair protein RecF [Pseudomonadota bacterium]